MIIKTIELLSDNELSIETLQTQINDGEYDDILSKYNFLILTSSGLCLVKKDKSIVVNACVDLSNYVTKTENHFHDNLEVLSQITPEMIEALNNLIQS